MAAASPEVRKIRAIIRGTRAQQANLRRGKNRATASRHVLKAESAALAKIEEIVAPKR